MAMTDNAVRWSPLHAASPPSPGHIAHWSRLYGGARTLAIATNAAAWQGPVIVITADAAAAARFEHEIGFFAPDLPRLTKPFRNADLAASLAAITRGNGQSD